MKLCLLVILAQFISPLANAQTGHTEKRGSDHTSRRSRGPEAVVRQLYRQVVKYRPLGIPRGEARAAIWPLLSQTLIRQFEVTMECAGDYNRQHPVEDRRRASNQYPLIPPEYDKPDFVWLESGLFSGENELALPNSFAVEGTAPQKDGTFRVYVRLTYFPANPQYRLPQPYQWRVAALVRRESGRFTIDDILLFKEGSIEIQSQLSHTLTVGCDGPRWVGNEQTEDK